MISQKHWVLLTVSLFKKEVSRLEEQNNSNNSRKSMLVMVAVAVVALVGIGAYSYMNMNKSAKPTEMTESNKMTASPTQTTSMTATTVALKDGTYKSEGAYTSPGGEEKIGLTVTLKDGLISDVEFEPMAKLPGSVKFQEIFSQNYKTMVVGKNISEVKLDKVAGSSLTPKGFNDALQKIIVQAQS